MQSGDRDEFTKTLRVLCAARGIPWTDDRDEAFWKGLAKMSLIQFNRAVDAMCASEDPPRNLTPGQVWQAFKAQRANGVTLTPTPGADEDKWGREANRRLMHHVTNYVAKDPQRYGRPASWEAMKASRDPNADASSEFLRNVQALVVAKNRWAQLMRASDEGDGVDPAEQNESWRVCLREAERDIEAYMQHVARSEAA